MTAVTIDTRAPNLSDKLAATLLQLRGDDGEPLVPYEDAKLMTASQICSLYVFDHWPIRRADGGPTAPWNLTPRLIRAHRDKTAKIDVPQMAKADRIRARLCEDCPPDGYPTDKTRCKPCPRTRRKRTIPARKLRSRGFQEGHRPLRNGD